MKRLDMHKPMMLALQVIALAGAIGALVFVGVLVDAMFRP